LLYLVTASEKILRQPDIFDYRTLLQLIATNPRLPADFYDKTHRALLPATFIPKGMLSEHIDSKRDLFVYGFTVFDYYNFLDSNNRDTGRDTPADLRSLFQRSFLIGATKLDSFESKFLSLETKLISTPRRVSLVPQEINNPVVINIY